MKKCMMVVVETVCRENKTVFRCSFSARTVIEMSENVKYNQKDCFGDLQFSQ